MAFNEKFNPLRFSNGLQSRSGHQTPEARHIEALDDIKEDLGKGKAGSTIRDLLDDLMSPILEAHAEVSQALATIRQVLSANANGRTPLLQEFEDHVSRVARHWLWALSARRSAVSC